MFEGVFRVTFGAQAKQHEDILGTSAPYGDYLLFTKPCPSSCPATPPPASSARGRAGAGAGAERGSAVENGIAAERVAVYPPRTTSSAPW